MPINFPVAVKVVRKKRLPLYLKKLWHRLLVGENSPAKNKGNTELQLKCLPSFHKCPNIYVTGRG
jgi:hypothetical protein